MHANKYDVIIIGGAAVGSAAAYFLCSNPDFNGSVLVVEKDFSYQYCATALSAASIRHQFSTPENIQMSQFGTRFLHNFSQDLAIGNDKPDAAFVEKGYLFLATESGLETIKENHSVQTSLGANIALLSSTELSEKFTWINTDDLAAGSLGLSGEGWLDAYGLMQGMRKKAIDLGAKYVESEVTEILTKNGVAYGVKLSNGTIIECGTVINAAGTAARKLAETAKIELPIESRKRSVFYVECPESLPGCPMVIDPSGAYFRPEGSGFITGIAPAANNDPECFDFNVQHELFEEVIWPTLANRVKAFEALRCTHSWAGHYDMNTLDQNVIVGPHPSVKNLLFANGFSGHGMQQSPAVGRALSELITYGRFTSLNLARLGWDRILNNNPIIEKNVV